VPALPAPRAVEVPAPVPAPAPSLDVEVAPADEDAVADELGAGDDLGDDVDDDELIGRAVERVPEAHTEDEGVFPGLDDDWIDDLSDTQVEQALHWLDQQGAG
ncbi:MAG TPA: hypothetical protein VHE35_17245, partial [Kofleriaceae bacterium]|nr:hypothetical protein [Kofleriaceae bacterium]